MNKFVKFYFIFILFFIFGCNDVNRFMILDSAVASNGIAVPKENIGTPEKTAKISSPVIDSVDNSEKSLVTIKWGAINNISSYKIYRAEYSETNSFKLLAELKALLDADGSVSKVQVFSDNGNYLPTKGGVRYFYKVASVSADNIVSKLSYSKSAIFYNDSINSPEVFVSTVASGFRVKWNLVSGAIFYYVYYYKKTDTNSIPTSIADFTEFEKIENGTEWTKNGLNSGAKYYICMVAENDRGEKSVLSEIKNVSVPFNVPVVDTLTLSKNYKDKIVLTWKHIKTASNTATKYRIERSQPIADKGEVINPVFTYLDEYTPSASATIITYEDKEELQEKRYYYRVIAIYGVQESSSENYDYGHIEFKEPELVITGDEIVYLESADSYDEDEYGFVATDNIDGSITDRVIYEIPEGVTNNIKGTYTILYKVRDGSDNKFNGDYIWTTASRTIVIVDAPNFTNAKIKLVQPGYLEKNSNIKFYLADVVFDVADKRDLEWTLNSGTVIKSKLGGDVTFEITAPKNSVVKTLFKSKANPSGVEFSRTFVNTIYDFNDGWQDCKMSGIVFINNVSGSWNSYKNFGPLSGSFSWGYGGGESTSEQLIDRSDISGRGYSGALLVCDTTKNTANWANVGDKMHTAAKVATPKISLTAGKYKVKSFVYHKGTNSADFGTVNVGTHIANIAKMGMRVVCSGVTSPTDVRNDIVDQWLPLEFEINLSTDVSDFSVEVFKGKIKNTFDNSYDTADNTNAQEVRFDDISIYRYEE